MEILLFVSVQFCCSQSTINSQILQLSFTSQPSPGLAKTLCKYESKSSRAFCRFFSAFSFALPMAAKASSRMATMRCCSGSGGIGIVISSNAYSVKSLFVLPLPFKDRIYLLRINNLKYFRYFFNIKSPNYFKKQFLCVSITTFINMLHLPSSINRCNFEKLIARFSNHFHFIRINFLQ